MPGTAGHPWQPVAFQKPDNIPHIKITAAYICAEDIGDSLAQPDQRYLRIAVADNGIGFDEKYVTKIFQMFQHLHGRGEFPGTGMGLAICKRVVENHQGFIVVKSKPAEGAIFSCYFPVDKAPLH
jgi:signal transduction histidine kinase